VGLVDKEGQAVRELEALRQGTTSVTDYIATFRQKAQYTQFSDYDLRLKFRSGLQTRVKEQLAHIPPREKDTLSKMIEVVVQIGQNFDELDGEKKRSAWQPRGSYAKDSTSRDPNAMDMDAAKQKAAPPRGTGGFKCYRCSEEGHMARNCPKPAGYKIKATTTSTEESTTDILKSMRSEFATMKAIVDGLQKKKEDFKMIEVICKPRS